MRGLPPRVEGLGSRVQRYLRTFLGPRGVLGLLG